MNFRYALDHHFRHGLGWTRSLATTTVQRSRVGQSNSQNIEKSSRRNPRSVQRPRLGQTNTAFIPRRAENAHSRRSGPDSFKASKRTSTAKPSDAESAKRLLQPYVLSSRLRKLCDEGQIDTAIAMLKSSAMGAQNTPVWNTVIWECMKAKRYGSAYKMFTDVCARPVILCFVILIPRCR